MKTKIKPIMNSLLIILIFTLLSMSKPIISKTGTTITSPTAIDSMLTPIEKLNTGLKFIRPIRQYIVKAGFGMRKHPILKVSRHHDGIDLKAEKDTKIFAVASGTIIKAGLKGGYGKFISISHASGFETRYGHLGKFIVKQGQKVERGDVIGLVGNTGLTIEPHLHFEIRDHDKPVNPNDHIKF